MTRFRPSHLALIALILLLAGCPPDNGGPPEEAQIEYFRSADGRASIEKGDSVTLEWKAVNSNQCNIQFTPANSEPGEVQPVECESSEGYTPTKTTNYRFTALKQDGQTFTIKDLTITVTSESVPTPPEVESTNPVDGATDISTNTSISVSFSEAMDRSATQAAFSTNPALACTFTWNADADVLICDPETDLAADTPYIITLGTEAKDEAGNALAKTYSFEFQTGTTSDTTPPEVIAISPNSGANGVPNSTNIKLSFSEPMSKNRTEAAFSAEPVISCSFSWNADAKELTCNPNTDLLSNETYTVTLGTGAEDLAGIALKNSYSRSFTTGSDDSAICTFGNATSKFGSCTFGD